MSQEREITHAERSDRVLTENFTSPVLLVVSGTFRERKPSFNSMKSAFLFLCLLSPLHATLLLNDTFSDGARNDADLPTSGNWVMVGTGVTGGTATTTVVNGALVAKSNASFSLTTYFNSTALGIGQTITLSFSLTTDFKGDAAADSFRFGLFNSGGSTLASDVSATNGSNAAFDAWTGYSFWSPYGSVTGTTSSIRERTGTNYILYNATANPSRDTVDYTSGNLVNATAYLGSFSITNNGSSLTISATLGNTTQTWTDTSPTATTFDSLSFFVGGTPIGTGGSFTLDNVKVEVIPEPSSALLLALLGMPAMLRRRR